MSVNVLLITHGDVGHALLDAVSSTLGDLPLPTTVVTVDYKCDTDRLRTTLQNMVNNLSPSEGVLVLTDLYGSTPSNIASRLECDKRIRVISGLNLPMLIRVMNYPHLGLRELADKALSGGKDGIINQPVDK